ncbi:MAG: prepilin-type N-terminal cleavage/methylation domain-containing protein [Candidatus Omnitrophica bacterium]|nr:prepilin-type N-terminal cleavage/methylation domain-containing protein [Candidatus Omnitrophota bacterium]
MNQPNKELTQVINISNCESRITRRAFTLLEILITLIIMVLGVVFVVGLFSTGLVSSYDAESTTVAMNLAQQRMEEFKNLDFDTEVVDEAKADIVGFPGFQREVIVSEPQIDLKKVIVKTYWTYKSDEISVALATYISKN